MIPMEDDRDIVELEELTVADAFRAGGKGANLGELARAGLPVPKVVEMIKQGQIIPGNLL